MTRAVSPRQVIAAKCRDCIYHSSNGGTWREQTALCTVFSCPLWGMRPLPAKAPSWITSRNSADLPDGWVTLEHDKALHQLRENIAAKAKTAAARAIPGSNSPDPLPLYRPDLIEPQTGLFRDCLGESMSRD